MTWQGWEQVALVLAAILLAAIPLGRLMLPMARGQAGPLARLERPLFAAAGIDPAAQQDWRGYALAMLAFNAGGFLLLYALLRLQGVLPLNPQGFAGLSPALAFNTAVSFVTNTNWQA